MSKLNISANECLSLDVMRMYHGKELSDRDMHCVEKHLLDCELCSDVIEGLDVKEIQIVRSITANVNRRVQAIAMSVPVTTSKPSFFRRYGWYFAVPVALLIAWLAWNAAKEDKTELAETSQPAAQNEIATENNNGPAPVKVAPLPAEKKEEVRTPQGVEKDLPPVVEEKVPGPETGKESQPVPPSSNEKKTEQPTETASNTPTETEKKSDEPSMPGTESGLPTVKTAPPVENWADLRIIEVKVIQKITATSGSKKSSGQSNGQLGSKSSKGDDAFFQPDEMPEFYGGDSEMKIWLARNFKNPVKDKRELKGKTTAVTFKVSSKGNVSDMEILKSLSPELDEELKRLFGVMPQWRPAKKKGTIQCTLSITFK
jgi:outer membrane biosynthesis protein TonB